MHIADTYLVHRVLIIIIPFVNFQIFVDTACIFQFPPVPSSAHLHDLPGPCSQLSFPFSFKNEEPGVLRREITCSSCTRTVAGLVQGPWRSLAGIKGAAPCRPQGRVVLSWEPGHLTAVGPAADIVA